MVHAHEIRIGNILYSNLTKVNFVVTVDDIVGISKDPGVANPVALEPGILEKMGFKGLPHFTVQNSIQKDIGRRRFISIGNAGTPNEMVFLTEEDPPKVNAVIVLRNYDYDGRTYVHHLQNLVLDLTNRELPIAL